jgi:hypothetical protein
MKIHPMGAELFHAGQWTDRAKLIATSCNFAYAAKKCCTLHPMQHDILKC